MIGYMGVPCLQVSRRFLEKPGHTHIKYSSRQRFISVKPKARSSTVRRPG